MTDWLFDTLCITTLLLVVVLNVRRPVARHFGPGIAYLLWLIPAARLLMPSLSVEMTANLPVNNSIQNVVAAAVLAGGQRATELPVTTGVALNWTFIAMTLWLGGAAMLFITQMVRYVSMRDDLLSDATGLGAVENIRLIQSDRVIGPLAFGLLGRYIVVPENFSSDYSPHERELAMQHEIAHHKSGDLFTNLIGFIILCLMWFNPFAWISWRAFRFDQEAACDARVLKGKPAEDRQVYGRALARAAHDGLPTFATALNSPKTIIERLRRLTMNDISMFRRLIGKIGVFGAIAVILPLTATTVPVAAADGVTVVQEGDASGKHVKVVRITRVKNGDSDAPYVQTITRNGRTIILRTDTRLSQQEIDKMVDDAEAGRIEADESIGDEEAARGEAEAARGDAEAAKSDAEAAKADAEAERADAETVGADARAEAANGAYAYAGAGNDATAIAAMVPDIQIAETTGNCEHAQPITTDVSNGDGKHKGRVRIVMCGKGMARMARASAIDGMKEALNQIRNDKDIPDSVRGRVMESLKKQIKRMQNEEG
jgi:bla regulator protein blaR1